MLGQGRFHYGIDYEILVWAYEDFLWPGTFCSSIFGAAMWYLSTYTLFLLRLWAVMLHAAGTLGVWLQGSYPMKLFHYTIIPPVILSFGQWYYYSASDTIIPPAILLFRHWYFYYFPWYFGLKHTANLLWLFRSRCTMIWASRDYGSAYCSFYTFHVVLICLCLHWGHTNISHTNLQSLEKTLQPQGHKMFLIKTFCYVLSS